MKTKKLVAAALACVLCVGLGIGGTLAWLVDTTNEVENTFTVGDINIDLTESGATLVEDVLKQNYDFVPGDKLDKNPTVTVKAGSEPCYLFIEVTEANNTCTGLTGEIIAWEVDEDVWTSLAGNVWYKVIDSETTSDTPYAVLDGNQVTVNEDITKDMVTTINGAKPSLTFKAYAVQKDNVADAAAAWAIAKPTT